MERSEEEEQMLLTRDSYDPQSLRKCQLLRYH